MGRHRTLTDEQRKVNDVARAIRYRAANRDKVNAYRRRFAKDNPEKIKSYMQKWYYKNHADTLQYHFDYRAKLKLEMVDAYGGCCQCCGEDEIAFLTVDHTYGWAARPDLYPNTRKQRGGAHLWLWLKKNGWPKDGFSVLCFNCNLGREKKKDRICPHSCRDYMHYVSGC